MTIVRRPPRRSIPQRMEHFLRMAGRQGLIRSYRRQLEAEASAQRERRLNYKRILIPSSGILIFYITTARAGSIRVPRDPAITEGGAGKRKKKKGVNCIIQKRKEEAFPGIFSLIGSAETRQGGKKRKKPTPLCRFLLSFFSRVKLCKCL